MARAVDAIFADIEKYHGAKYAGEKLGNESEYLKLVEKNRGKEAAGRLRDRAREIVREHRKGV